MQRSRKAKRIIDYRIFHRTGEKVDKVAVEKRPLEFIEEAVFKDKNMSTDENTAGNGSTSKDRIALEGKMISQLQALSDDIDDYIDENPSNEICESLSDLDFVIRKMEEMRSIYRSKHKELIIHTESC